MKGISFFAILMLFASTSCTSSRSLTRLSVPEPLVVRAGSDLSDLQKQAHEEETKSKKKETASTAQKSDGRKTDRCSSTADAENNIAGQLFLLGLKAPFLIHAALLNDNYDHVTEFPDHPYVDGLPGSLLIETEYQGKRKSWGANVQLVTVQDANDVGRYGSRVVVESGESRFGVDSEINFWNQKLSNGNTNQLWTGDANLIYRFAESESIQFRAGVGVNWLTDKTEPEAGINFTYGVDIFPVRPWTLSTVFDFGTLGSGGLFHNRSTAGVMMGPVEAFAGYDYFELGTARFHGPIAGVGWRF